MRYAIGIDAGSVSVNAAVLDEGGRVVYEEPYRRHFGRVLPAEIGRAHV